MTSKTKDSPYAAAGAYRGFSLQDVRLGFHLISAPPGCLVSIEHKDDVAIHYPDGVILHEQVKSAPRSEPLRDTAPELWKTLANWGETVNPVSNSTTARFQIYVVPPRTGDIATLIDAAKTDSDADAVISAADELLKTAAETARKQIKRFQDIPLETRRYVIRKTQILNSDESEYVSLYEKLGAGVILPLAVVKQAAHYLIGMAQTTARELLRADTTAILNADEFKKELQAFVIRTNMQRLLPSSAHPSQTDIESEFIERPVFVRQLELVNATRDQQISAVADFLQASASKATWAANGLVLTSGLDRWDSTLISAHASYQMRVAVEHGNKPPEDRGRVLLSHCYTHKEKLDANDVGQEFVRGSFHGLADREMVGWHDDYKTHLINRR